MLRLALRILPLAILILVAVAVFASGVGSDLTLSGLARHEQAWRAAAAREPAVSLITFMAVYAVLTAAGLPVALVLTLTGGAVFGPVRGALAALAAANVAALIGYAAARSALGPAMGRWLEAGGGHARELVRRLRERAFWTILAARLMPAMPFAAVNLAGGLARAPLGAFVGASVLGGLPSAFIGATLGAGVGAQLSTESLAHAVRTPMVWGPLLALSMLSIVPLVWSRGRGASEPG